jgi:hypothetical protein
VLPHLLCCLALLTQTAPEPEIPALVARLGAPRFSERQAAARELRRLGEVALTSLREARASRDPEVAARARALVEAIETGLMLEPTRVRLDARDRPLPEVVAELARQADVPIALDPRARARLADRRVHLDLDGPVPLWQALDRLGREADLGVTIGVPESDGLSELTPGESLLLFDRKGGLAAPVCDVGPFRVKVVGTHYQRDRAFENGPIAVGRRGVDEQAQILLQVLAEPRLTIASKGPVRLVEAVDDQGQSLLPDDPNRPDALLFSEGFSAFGTGSTLEQPVEIRRPARPGGRIRRLRGTLGLTIAARKTNPLTVPLEAATGRTFQGDDVALTVHALHADPNDQQVTLEMTLQPPRPASRGARSPAVAAALSTEFLENQIEVADAQGRRFVLFPMELTPQGDAIHATLLLAPTDGATRPARLRFFGLVRTEREIEFQFADIEMP